VSTLVVTPLTVPVDFSSAAATIVEEGVGVGEVGGVVGDVVAHVVSVPTAHGGARLHRAHRSARNGPVPLLDIPPSARGKGGATDSDRVGIRQPFLGWNIGGPC
jgi:hypothetical protein